MTAKINDFLSEIKKRDLARPNRFVVEIGGDYFISLMASAAVLPPIMLNVRSLKYFGPSYQRPISNEYGGDGISVTFNVDQDMGVKRYFDAWTQSVVSLQGGVNYQDQYVRPVLIKQLNNQDNEVYKIKLIDAFPRSVNMMQLNQASQNQTHTLDVLFAYRYWIYD